MAMDVIAKNLLRLRIDQELSQEELATKADLSLTAYKNIESGSAEPKITTLQSLAAALGVSLTNLLIPVKELKYVRFRADKKMKRRSQVLANVATWLENYNFLTHELDLECTNTFDNCVFQKPIKLYENLTKSSDETIRRQRAIEAAKEARNALFNKDNAYYSGEGHLGKIDEPIRNICGLLEKSGIKIHTIEMATDSFFGLSISEKDKGPAIVINTWNRLSVERKIFTAAQELGHLILHHDAYDITQEIENKEEEKEANIFASYFLMPIYSFEKRKEELEGLNFYDMVIGLKTYFGVSYQAVLVRLANDNRDHWYRLMDHFQQSYKERYSRSLPRTEEAPPQADPSDFDAYKKAEEPENMSDYNFEEARLGMLVRQALKKDVITASKAAEILELDMETMRKRIEGWNAVELATA